VAFWRKRAFAETDHLKQGQEDDDRVQPRLGGVEEHREAGGGLVADARADAIHLVCQRVVGELDLHLRRRRQAVEDGLEGSRQPVGVDLQALAGNDLALHRGGEAEAALLVPSHQLHGGVLEALVLQHPLADGLLPRLEVLLLLLTGGTGQECGSLQGEQP